MPIIRIVTDDERIVKEINIIGLQLDTIAGREDLMVVIMDAVLRGRTAEEDLPSGPTKPADMLYEALTRLNAAMGTSIIESHYPPPSLARLEGIRDEIGLALIQVSRAIKCSTSSDN